MKDRYLSTAELAARWGVSTSTLRNWRQSGQGPAFFKPAGARNSAVRYRLVDILAYEKSRTKETT